MLRRRSPQGATLAPDGSARPDCTGCCVRRGDKYRTLHTEKSTQRGDGALPMPQGRGLRADREGQHPINATAHKRCRRCTAATAPTTPATNMNEVPNQATTCSTPAYRIKA